MHVGSSGNGADGAFLGLSQKKFRLGVVHHHIGFVPIEELGVESGELFGDVRTTMARVHVYRSGIQSVRQAFLIQWIQVAIKSAADDH